MGSPVTFVVENRDFKNWEKRMSTDPANRGEAKVVTRPRPGHADLAGVLKYNLEDIRDVLERASARETTARVAIGAFAKQLVAPFGVNILGYVVSIGATEAKIPPEISLEQLTRVTEESPVRVPPTPKPNARSSRKSTSAKNRAIPSAAWSKSWPQVCRPGSAIVVQWDRKLDGRIGHALMSIQAVKGVEFGMGFEAARVRGSLLHDEIGYDAAARNFTRHSNNSGGTEGGMSTGEPLRVRVAFKPLSTLMRPLRSADIKTKAEAAGTIERSDAADPAAAVIAETVVAFEVASAFLEKFGGDSLAEITRNYNGYLEQVRGY